MLGCGEGIRVPELEVLADYYILKRAQALTLKWAIEKRQPSRLKLGSE